MKSKPNVRRTYVDVSCGQLHLRIATAKRRPQPRTVVAFHMSPMSGRIYESLQVRLARARSVIAPDTPGFGLSDAPNRLPKIGDYSDLLWEGLRRAGVTTPVDLIGYHTGSLIAADMAARFPRRVRRAALISAPVFTNAERRALHKHYRRVVPKRDGSHLARMWRSYCFYNVRPGQTIEEAAEMFPEALLGRGKAWWGHHAAFEFDLEAALSRVKQPVLVLNPGDDLQRETRRASAVLRRGLIVELPRWNHGFLDSSTEAAARLFESFFDAPDDDPFSALKIPGWGRKADG